MPDPTDLPTLEQVAAYLKARGWAVHPASGTDPRGMLVWQKGDHMVRLVPSRMGGAQHHPGSIRWALVAIAQIEGRPTPAEQVRRDMVGGDPAAAAAASAMDAWRRDDAVRDE